MLVIAPKDRAWIESIHKLDGGVEQINGHPAIDLTAKPAPTHDRTDLIPIPKLMAHACHSTQGQINSWDESRLKAVIGRALRFRAGKL